MKPELLAPAGSMDALRAAVQNGADAVYLGWGRFHARQGARGFTKDELVQAVRDCHRMGVKVYLTLNTLVTDRELPEALDIARTASRLGIDAVLLQDWGLFVLVRETLPDLPIHASTQMSIFTSGGALLAADLGMTRIVLARECSRDDVARIQRNCPAELELFVHGALCMCYSGQCAMSALIGGRSGNRGHCAQPCRLPYGLDRPPKGEYPLSLKDNCLADSLPELSEMGIDCLKVEGRMKRPDYVAAVTGIYAKLLQENRCPTRDEYQRLESAFSRSGFTDGYWQGRIGKDMFGIHQDTVQSVPVAETAERTVPITLICQVRTNVPCTLTACDMDGHTVTVSGPVPEQAQHWELTAEDLAQRLRKTGGTGYTCSEARVSTETGLFLTAAAVNALRRDVLSALSATRTAVPPRREQDAAPLPDTDCSADTPRWTISVCRMEQLTPEVLDCQPARIYVPLEQFQTLDSLPDCNTEWCAILPRVWRDRDEPQLLDRLSEAKELGVSGVLLGNLGQIPLTARSGLVRYGDFGLNVTNARSLEFLRRLGLSSVCVSFELQAVQIRAMRKVLPTEAIVYGNLPLMITEHNLIPDDGRTHVLADRTGAKFPLLRAYGNRTEIENSRPLYLADKTVYRTLGLRYARLRFTIESPEECGRIVHAYRDEVPMNGKFTRGLWFRGVV